jgi:hypothetical protein
VSAGLHKPGSLGPSARTQARSRARLPAGRSLRVAEGASPPPSSSPMNVKSISKSATVAWSPLQQRPGLLAVPAMPPSTYRGSGSWRLQWHGLLRGEPALHLFRRTLLSCGAHSLTNSLTHRGALALAVSMSLLIAMIHVEFSSQS